jgi:hypothetical protein
MSARRKAILFAAILLIVFGWRSYSRSRSHRAHEQLLAFRASLSLGMSGDAVERAFTSASYGDLTLRKWEDGWFVCTPLEFGASNWCLHLAFANGSLNKILVRSVDLPNRRPDEAPPDIVDQQP